MLDSSEVRESIRVSRSVQWPGPGVTRPGSDLNPLKPPALSTPSSGGDILQQFACLQTDKSYKDNCVLIFIMLSCFKYTAQVIFLYYLISNIKCPISHLSGKYSPLGWARLHHCLEQTEPMHLSCRSNQGGWGSCNQVLNWERCRRDHRLASEYEQIINH